MKSRFTNMFLLLAVAIIVPAYSSAMQDKDPDTETRKNIRKSTQKIIKTGDPEFIYGKALEQYDKGNWSRATKLFEAVEYLYVGSTREDSISFYMARCKAKTGDYYAAIDMADEFRLEHARSPFIEDVESMRAMSYFYLAPGPTRDQTTINTALSAAVEFIARYPESPRSKTFEGIVAELQERLYDKAFINAYTYYKIGRYKSAIIAFRNAIKQYPESTRREDLLYYVVASSYELAKNSVEVKQQDRYISTLDSYYTFIAEFPESEKYSKQIAKIAKESKEFVEKHVDDDPEKQKKEAEEEANFIY